MGHRHSAVALPVYVPSVRENLSSGKYKTTLAYPDKPVKPDSKVDLATVSDKEVADRRAALRKYEEDFVAYKAAKLAYGEDEGRLHKLFCDDLEAEHGMAGHPKADKLMNMAYDKGHSGGMGDVVTEYEELLELVKD